MHSFFSSFSSSLSPTHRLPSASVQDLAPTANAPTPGHQVTASSNALGSAISANAVPPAGAVLTQNNSQATAADGYDADDEDEGSDGGVEVEEEEEKAAKADAKKAKAAAANAAKKARRAARAADDD